MKIIYNNIIPPKGYAAINICGILFVRKNINISDKLINHENIHTHQIKELLYIFFYIWYILEFMLRLIQYRNWNQAYSNEDNYMYLSDRKIFSSIRYLNINK